MNKTSQQKEIENLEAAFWKSIVDKDSATAIKMLHEPALMVSPHGAMSFDHANYKKMLKNETYRLVDYNISDMNVLCPTEDVAVASYHVHQTVEKDGKKMEMNATDSSTWIKISGAWQCLIHTESLEAPTT